MTIVDALRETVGGGRAIRPGSAWAYQVRGAGGSIFAIDLDPSAPPHRKELPSGPNNIKHLMADDWSVDSRDAGPTLATLFPNTLAAAGVRERTLTEVFDLKPDKAIGGMTIETLLKNWSDRRAA